MNIYQRIVHLHRQGHHNNEIARLAGSSAAYVSKVLASEGLVRNQLRVGKEAYFKKMADKRGITVVELKRKLWAVIDEDRMVDAILDDESDPPRQGARHEQDLRL